MSRLANALCYREERDWFVFQPSEDEATIHASYRLAVREAQSRGCTEHRPERIAAGFYQLFGCGPIRHQYYIVSQPMMKANFLQLMENTYRDCA